MKPNRLAGLVSGLRNKYPNAVGHADNTSVIAPKELSNRIRHIFTGHVIEPIFIKSLGKRTLVVPRTAGGVDYVTVPMNDALANV